MTQRPRTVMRLFLYRNPRLKSTVKSGKKVIGVLKTTSSVVMSVHVGQKDCPLSSRNRYGGRTLFPEPDTPAYKKTGKSTEISEVDAGSTPLGKRSKPTSDEVCSPKRKKTDTPSFKAGDYVSLHVNKVNDQHIPCRVVQVVRGKMYRLYCRLGVLRGTYVSSELRTLCSSDLSISVGD